MTPQYVIGVDYGTLSGRALVVRVSDGAPVRPALNGAEVVLGQMFHVA